MGRLSAAASFIVQLSPEDNRVPGARTAASGYTGRVPWSRGLNKLSSKSQRAIS